MVQIISDKPSDWVEWICGVIDRLEKYSSITKMVIIAEAEANEDDDINHQVIEFMNCSTNDVYNLGGLIQKEALKHELLEELGIEDEFWEEDEE